MTPYSTNFHGYIEWLGSDNFGTPGKGLMNIKIKISTPGVYYYIFQRLAWEGIIIHEVISTTNEFTIIVSDDQIDVAFKVIKDLKNVFD